MRLLSRRLLPIVVVVRCFSVQDAGSYTWPERVLLLDSVATVVSIGNSRSTSSRGGVVSVFRERFYRDIPTWVPWCRCYVSVTVEGCNCYGWDG